MSYGSRGAQASRSLEMAFLPTASARGSRRVRDLSELVHRIRRDPELDHVLDAAIEVVREELVPRRAAIWLTDGEGPPRLARCTWSADPGDPEPPQTVLACAVRRRPEVDRIGTELALPIEAPRSGLLGVLYLDGATWGRDQQRLAETVARETGPALEAASLYERAIAERDKSEAILARVGDAVVVTDRAGTIEQLNEAARRVFGCGSEQPAAGLSCAHVLALRSGAEPLDCSGCCPLLALSEAREGELGVELWREDAEGRRQPLVATASALRDADGSIRQVVHSLRDITRLKEAEEAKTLFLATASHELKTPLTVIQGFAQALLDRPNWDEESRERALRAIATRAVELNRIVNRILLSSRIEAGSARVSVSDVDLRPLLAERVEALRSSSGREIALHVSPELPRARVDEEAFVTVIDHLLDNAIKYSPRGEAVSVVADATPHAVTFAVTDSGIGMDEEQRAHCFDQFWQAESSDARRFGGAGIGLYVVRSLVEAMGATISVISAPGRGSTFTVTLERAGVLGARPEPEPEPVAEVVQFAADPSIVREFMRQIGVQPRRGAK